MPLRDSYPTGTPSRVDLITSDVESAFGFYRAVLGWEYERDPTGEISYVMATVEGHPAAGVMALPTEMIDQNVPPCWNVYITVDDADVTAQRIVDLDDEFQGFEPSFFWDSGCWARRGSC